MKALILAAGLGTRLAPITDSKPKCMTEVVNGKTIIEKQIENLLDNGITEIAVITGYKSELLKAYINKLFDNIVFINNADCINTNNMYSAFLGKNFINGDNFIMMNADVYFDSSVLKKLIEFDFDNAIVTDIGNYNDESMKVIEKNNFLVEISKQIKKAYALGCSIDVYKFSREGGAKFFDRCEYYITVEKEMKLWSEVALNDILKECKFRACPLNGKWVEIDTHEDLKIAKEIFKNDIL